jgi:Xaa-Pro aminopeptidase
VPSKFNQVRNFLSEAGVDAVILRHGDEYFSEEVPPHYQVFSWLTGLDVSYGYIVVSQKIAALFVDGRYILAAQELLGNSIWTVHNIKKVSPFAWIAANLIGKIALDPKLHSINEVENLIQSVGEKRKIELIDNLVDHFWKDRPPLETSQICEHPLEYAGESSKSKLSRIAEHLNQQHCEAIFISNPCDVAWVMNIRGRDLKHTPVAFARMVVFNDGSYKIYTDASSSDLKTYPSAQILADLNSFKGKILIDPSNTPYSIKAQLGFAETVYRPCIVQSFKSIKNANELDGARKANILDGVAITSLLFWLHQKMADGANVFEKDVSEKIAELRAKSDLYVSDSFSCIAAFGKNAANVHYKTAGRGEGLSRTGLFLLDTGGQYRCGTTDMTRTMCFNWPAVEEQDAYTRVLKGHIALASAVFPVGTTGYQIDCLARQYLWQVGLDYDHGTGHGIGSFLGVHEGPHNFSRKPSSDNALQADTLITIEPGYYLKDRFGIRIENTNQIVKLTTQEDGGEFLTFATLTAVPMDFKLTMPPLLNEQEKVWLRSYHEWVLRTLTPLLDDTVKSWLIEQTNPYFNVL